MWSLYRCGEMYRDGLGTDADPIESEKYFLRAARLGNTGAMAAVIDLSSKGIKEKTQATDECMKLLESAAVNGNIDACRKLGNYYFDGRVVSKDYKKALEWYEKGAMLGDSWSKTRAAEMCRDGKGVPTDSEKGRKDL